VNPSETPRVRLFPSLSAAALKAGLDKELTLWYELRAINSWGSGRLVLNNAVAALVSSFGYTRSTAYRLLKAGDQLLWQVHNSRHPVVEIYGLLRVAERFNTYPGHPVEIKAKDFRGRKAKRAWLYASFFKPSGSKSKPISRNSIEAATGVKRRQQQRYDKVVDIKRVADFAVQQDGKGKLYPIRQLVEGKCRQWLKDRRLGNIYHSRALKAHRGMTKKVNGKLRQRSLGRDEARLPKRFFLTPQSLIKCPERQGEAFLLVNKRDRLIPGRMEWCLV